jgi:hypothetical protein
MTKGSKKNRIKGGTNNHEIVNSTTFNRNTEVVGDNNSNFENKHIMAKRGGKTNTNPSKLFKTPKKSKLFKTPKNTKPNKQPKPNKRNHNGKIPAIGYNTHITNITNIKLPMEKKEESLFSSPYPPEEKEKETEIVRKEDHEIDEILEYIDMNYIMNEKNSIEDIMEYISYCVYQWELYKDYMIPKDEYYQNMIDELYNDSLYTNNIDKDYDFIPNEKQSGGNNEDGKNKRPILSTTSEGTTTSEELPPLKRSNTSNTTPEEKINIIKDIFSKNDNYHDFLKGTRAVYLKPPKVEIINKIGNLLDPQEQTSSTSSTQLQSFNQDDVLNEYSKILQNHPHSEGSVLKGTLSIPGIDTKKTFSSYIKDDELEKFINEMNKPGNTDKKNSIIANYFIIPKISQKENGELTLEDNYMYFIRKDLKPKDNSKMLQHICKDMGLTYTVCLGVFLNNLVSNSYTETRSDSMLDNINNYKTFSKMYKKQMNEKLSSFPFLQEIKTLAKKMDPIVRSSNQTVDENLDYIYKSAYQFVLKYLFGIKYEIQYLSYNDVMVKITLKSGNTIDFYFTTNTVEIVSEAIVSIIEKTTSENNEVKQIIETAIQIHKLQSTKDDILVILTKLKTQGDLYQVITAYLINLQYPNNPISFYTEDRLCLSIAFMINNFLEKEVKNPKPLNVFFKASSGQYEDETNEENILMDTKMNKEVTVCSSEMLLTTKNDYILMCKNEISKVEQDFIKFRDRFADKPDEYGINKMYEYARKQLNTYLKLIPIMDSTDGNEEEKSDSGKTTNESVSVDDVEIMTTDEINETDEINDNDKEYIDGIRINVANLHSLIDFNENVSDDFLNFAFDAVPTDTGGLINKMKKCFKTNVPISKQFTHFGNFKVKSWMEWKLDNSGINKYLKENINSLEEREKKLEKALVFINTIDTNVIDISSFNSFLSNLKTKSDVLIEAFFNDFKNKINALKTHQEKKPGLRSRGTKKISDTSEEDNLSEERDEINCNIATLNQEKDTIIREIKTPIWTNISKDESNKNKTLQEKEGILSKIIEKIIKNRNLTLKENKYIPQIESLRYRLSGIKNTIKKYSKNLISCAKKIVTEQNKNAEPNYVPEEVKVNLINYLDTEKRRIGQSPAAASSSTQASSSSSTQASSSSSTQASSSSTLGGKHKKSRKNRKIRTKLKNKNKKTKRKTKRKTKHKSKRTKKQYKTIKKHKRTRKKKQYKD